MAEEIGEVEIPIINRVQDSPMVFVDSIYHVSSSMGTARLAFVQNFTEPDEDIDWKARHAITLVMPLVRMRQMRDYLNTILSDMEEKGVFADVDG